MMINPTALAMFGWTEIMLIAGLVVLLFGATRLPKIGKGLGEGINEFKNALTKKPDQDDSKKPIEGGEGSSDGS